MSYDDNLFEILINEVEKEEFNSRPPKNEKIIEIIRDVVTFLSVEGPNKWARGQTWGGLSIRLLYSNPYSAQNVGGPGPPGPLGDYIPALFSQY